MRLLLWLRPGFGHCRRVNLAVPGIFPATRWSMVLTAGQAASPEAEAALERLCASYREPVLSHLRSLGVPPGDAEDLVQSFFQSLLKRNSFANVAPERGRFRTYLKRALRYHLLDQPRPLPAALTVELDALEADARAAYEPRHEDRPSDALDRAWAEHVLHLAYSRLEARHRFADDAVLFGRLRQFLAAEPAAGDYAALATELGTGANTVAKRVQRLREEFNECIRAELLETVGTPSEVEAEVRALFS